MKRSVHILVFFLLTHVNIYSQESKIFADAMELYQTKNYTAARELFLKVDHKDDIDKKLISTVKYFAADCLLKLGQLNGAIEEFENFTSVYRFSNYRDEAFYKLGTIYFEKGQYSLVRQKLLILINEYPESEYLGSSYFWVGESYVNENKFLEGEEFLLEAVSASKSNRFV
ncbi:MAG: tetratricopeptide repeat protein, partial [Melioribacteraceae bacterium]|nr:tetratricopeptide repeat protein [Melioribacteraceae bacterium]